MESNGGQQSAMEGGRQRLTRGEEIHEQVVLCRLCLPARKLDRESVSLDEPRAVGFFVLRLLVLPHDVG